MSYALPDNILIQEVIDETVLLDLEKGAYFELNSIASDMLRSLREHGNTELVISELLKSYDTDRATIEADLKTLIDQMHEHGLISHV